jgi:hypothetical protein
MMLDDSWSSHAPSNPQRDKAWASDVNEVGSFNQG